MGFDEDIAFTRLMQPYADKVYQEVLPIAKDGITRFDRDENQVNILDKEFHMDLVLTLTNGQIITLQEKLLRDKYAYYDCFTLEYLNNRFNGDHGEWHRLCTDLYFTAYGSPDKGFLSAYLFKTIDFKLALVKGRIEGILKNTSTSNANFYAYPFNKFKDEWFIYKKNFRRTNG